MSYGNYPELKNVKKVLVIKLRHLGDVLLTSPVFTSLKKKLPSASIDALIYREAKPMLEGHFAIDEIRTFDRSIKKSNFFKRALYELKFLWKIRKQKYDLVINLTEGDRGRIAAKFARAKYRVGFEPKRKKHRKFYTHIVKHTPGLKHTVERNLDAVRCIGIFPGPEERKLYLKVSPIESILGWVGALPFVLIHPTSRWRFKCWSNQKMRDCILWLQSLGKKVVVTSGPDLIEVEMVEKITEGLDVINIAGKTTLKELGAIINASELFITVDTVAFHIANALKKKVIVLFGPTSEVNWGPWENPHAKVLKQNLPCRPCFQDGCGGSKYSDCLQTLPLSWVQEAVLSSTEESSSLKSLKKLAVRA